MGFIRFCLLFTVAFALCSCKHEVREISPDKIGGYWELQNDVKFSGLAFTHMCVNDLHNSVVVDPVVSDTIYEYKKAFVIGDSLCLIDYNDNEMIVRIKELSDSALILTDFPGASDDLVFRNPEYELCTVYEDGSCSFKPSPMREYNISKDSLDINMKSYDAKEWANANGVYVPLSSQQVAKARDIAKEYLNNKSFLHNDEVYEEPRDFDEYLRQYFGYMKDEKLIVAIEMSLLHHPTDNPFPYSGLKTWIVAGDDGGSAYLHFRIDINAGKVLSFGSNYCLGDY